MIPQFAKMPLQWLPWACTNSWWCWRNPSESLNTAWATLRWSARTKVRTPWTVLTLPFAITKKSRWSRPRRARRRNLQGRMCLADASSQRLAHFSRWPTVGDSRRWVATWRCRSPMLSAANRCSSPRRNRCRQLCRRARMYSILVLIFWR